MLSNFIALRIMYKRFFFYWKNKTKLGKMTYYSIPQASSDVFSFAVLKTEMKVCLTLCKLPPSHVPASSQNSNIYWKAQQKKPNKV